MARRLAIASAGTVLSAFIAACGSPTQGLPPSTLGNTRPTTTTAAAEPPCEASQLTATAGHKTAGAGNLFNAVMFVNHGAICLLQGYPQIMGVSASRGRVPLAPGHLPAIGFPVPSAMNYLDTGELVIQTSDVCGAINQPNQANQANPSAAGSIYQGLIIELPRSGGSLSVSGLSFDVAWCGKASSEKRGRSLSAHQSLWSMGSGSW